MDVTSVDTEGGQDGGTEEEEEVCIQTQSVEGNIGIREKIVNERPGR